MMIDNDPIKDFVRDMKARRTASVMWSHAYIGYEETIFSQELTIKAVPPETIGNVLKKLTDVIAEIEAESLHDDFHRKADIIDGNLSG